MRLLQDRHTPDGRTFVHEQCAHGAWIAVGLTAVLVGLAGLGGVVAAPFVVVGIMLALGVPSLYVLMTDLCVDDIRQRRAVKAAKPVRRHDEPAWLR